MMLCNTVQMTAKTLNIFTSVLNKHTPKKKIVIRGNHHELYLNNELAETIM